MKAQPVKESLGPVRSCDGCGVKGRERRWPHNTDPKKWCCSSTCAEKVMSEPGWGSIMWLKV